jgi:hypothetical protein
LLAAITSAGSQAGSGGWLGGAGVVNASVGGRDAITSIPFCLWGRHPLLGSRRLATANLHALFRASHGLLLTEARGVVAKRTASPGHRRRGRADMAMPLGEPGVAQVEPPPLSRPRMDLCGVWCCKSMEAEAALHANKDASNRSGKCQRPASGVAGGDKVHGWGEHSRQLGWRQAGSYAFSCSWGKNQRP